MENGQILQSLAGEMERSLRPWVALWGETILVTHLQEFLTSPSSSKRKKKKVGTYYIINYILNALFVFLFYLFNFK